MDPIEPEDLPPLVEHTCRTCGAVVRWAGDRDPRRDAWGTLGECSCPGRRWKWSATPKRPRRRPRWRAATAREERLHGPDRNERRRAERAARPPRDPAVLTIRQVRPHRPPYDAALPRTRTYREHLLACQLAADCEGMGLAAWIRRTLSAEAGRVLRARHHSVPRRVLDLAAAGRLEQLEQLAATLAGGEHSSPDSSASVSVSPK